MEDERDVKTGLEESCSFIFKKRKARNTEYRKRPKSSSEEEKSNSSDEEPSVKRPNHRKSKKNPNVQSTSKKKQQENENVNDSSSEEDLLVSYKSKRSAMAEGPTDQGATAILEIETERDRDAQALFEKRLEINKELEGKEDDKTAAGNASSGLVRKGPIRAPANLRATVRWDYQPDICKDYKETGFCGFGDSCIFLHDRSDYKHGWQLEREWAEGKYGQESDEDKKYEIDSFLDMNSRKIFY
ncbi:E3 ubiquitin-protein ligase RNF113A-like [Zophobas morio]|uniref:E3 ubiquitin-protein ligase RNF113A-like n=1 Tax=Zophobas morio TaxID=2755281 RepID=UPI00308306FC